MIRKNLASVEPRSLGLILLLIGFVFATTIVLYMIKPQYQQFDQISSSYKMLNSQIDDQAQLQSAIDSERKQIQEMQLRLGGDAGEMPVNEMEAYLVGRLQELAWESGIELSGVRPGPAKRIMEFEEISFKVEVTGEYKNLYDWLNRIGDKLGFMLVSNYEISAHGRKSNETPLKMNVTIVFYRAVDI